MLAMDQLSLDPGKEVLVSLLGMTTYIYTIPDH
jgi:hypothetical protein